MAWFGDGLSSLSNLKGQITNFTKEVLSDSTNDQHGNSLVNHEAGHDNPMDLQELLVSKDTEIALLRRQNCELQKAVVELNSLGNNDKAEKEDDDGGGFFWDPPRINNSNIQSTIVDGKPSKSTVKINELQNNKQVTRKNQNDEVKDNHNESELVCASQNLLKCINQMENKMKGEQGTEENKIDESLFVSDLRSALLSLKSKGKLSLLHSALNGLDMENNEINKSKATDENGVIEFKKKEEEFMIKIRELQEENANLSAGIEELDQQHSETIDNILSLKDELQKKHQALQSAYETLYVDYNNAQEKLEQFEKSNKPLNKNELIDVELNNVELKNENNQTKDNDILDEIKKRLKEILKNSNIEEIESETIFETIAKRFVDAEWKKDMLERELTELNRELKDACDFRDSLQVDCCDLQGQVDSLEHELQIMKLNLPSIPEGNEEFETMSIELRRLQNDYDELSKIHADDKVKIENLEKIIKDKSNYEEEIKEQQEKLEIALKDIEEKTKMFNDLTVKFNNVLGENANLQMTIEKYELIQREMKENMIINYEKIAKLEEDKIENEKLKKEIEMYEKELIESTEYTRAIEEKIAKLEKDKIENEKLKEEIEVYKKDLNESAEHTRAIEEKIAKLEEDKIENEKLKKEIELYKKDLNESAEHTRAIEDEIIKIQDEIKNNECTNGLSPLDDKFESELNSLVDNNSENNNDKKLLKYLQSQLESANTERDDLEYDISNMRKELDIALKEVAKCEADCTLVRELNKELKIKNDSIMEQLSMISIDNSQRVDNLQAEINNLQQEHVFLQNEAAVEKAELIETREKCNQLSKKYLEKEEELNKLNVKCSQLENDYAVIKQKLDDADEKIKQLENELSSKISSQELTDDLNDINKKYEDEKKSTKESNEALLKLIEEKDKKLDEKMQLINELNDVKKKYEDSLTMGKETIETLSKLIKEKDQEIDDKKVNNEKIIDQLTSEKNELVRLVQVKHNESLQYHAEIQRLTHLFTEQTSRLEKIIAENEIINCSIKEKESELLWAQNELQVVRQRLKNFEESNNYGENCNIPEHVNKLSQVNTLNEKCNALEAALVQEQSNSRLLQDQLNECQLKESNAEKELERLRTHLVEMEASYTEEALLMDQGKQELEAKLMLAEEKVQNSSNVYTSASIRANQQVETLQQQMALIVQQRDELQIKLSAAEDKVLSHTASLTNLQIVLEQFQRDKETDIRNATEKIRQQLNSSFKKQEELLGEISSLKTQLAEAKECLQAASRLSEQLEKKSERIEELKQEVDNLTEFVNTADEKIQEAKKSGEGKVDKNLVKNLLLGLVSSAASDKSSILRVFSTVLDFDETEKEKAGLNNPAGHGSWFSSLIGGNNQPTKDQEASLSAAFVRFLESESKPMRTMPALPLTNTQQISTPGHSRQASSSSTQSAGLLLSNVTLPAFPDFVPSRNTGSILKEVLKDN